MFKMRSPVVGASSTNDASVELRSAGRQQREMPQRPDDGDTELYPGDVLEARQALLYS